MVEAKSPRLEREPRPKMSLSCWMAAVLPLSIRASILSIMEMMREMQSEGANFISGLYQLGYSYWTVMVALLAMPPAKISLYIFIVNATCEPAREPPYMTHGVSGLLRSASTPGNLTCCLKYSLSAIATTH